MVSNPRDDSYFIYPRLRYDPEGLHGEPGQQNQGGTDRLQRCRQLASLEVSE